MFSSTLLLPQLGFDCVKQCCFLDSLKYVIKLHVAKVAVGILHLNFLQLAPGQSTSFKLVDHSPTHNFSTERARPYILMSLNVHWCISEHTHWLVSSDARMHPAWRNWLIFRDAYYAYILVHLVLACTVLFSFLPSFSASLAGHLVGFIFMGKVFRNTFRMLELDERKGRWVVEQDFHGNFQVNVTWFFASFSRVLDWIVLILVWFERSLHSTPVSGHKLSMTVKTDDVTSSRSTWTSMGGYGWLRGKWVNKSFI